MNTPSNDMNTNAKLEKKSVDPTAVIIAVIMSLPLIMATYQQIINLLTMLTL